jgi:hypothetical protein
MVTTPASAGGLRAAICRPLKPPQEMPIMPTLPLLQGCSAAQAMTSQPSDCSCSVYSSNMRPSDSPLPRMSTRRQANPRAASCGWKISSRSKVPSRLR